jgi:glycosyltransferase involved in cell wall biosynthesis
VRVLVFHGYLLRGTGSNVYNASLARALVALGHEVHLLCQDRAAGSLDWVDAVGTWRDGRLSVEVLRRPVRCTAYLPDIGGVLPLYVADCYEGFDARPFVELSDAEVERYLEANAAAVRDVVARVAPGAALANHLVMGPAILARGLAGAVPYAVKVHGSALEYTVRRQPERFLGYAREGLAGAGGVLVGSAHVAERLWALMADPELPGRTRLGPPGVDVATFRPRGPDEAAAELVRLADRIEGEAAAEWGGEEGAARALRSIDPARDRLVTYVGKLIVSKGVDLLLAAWPLVCAEVPRARLVVVGFGTYRDALARLAGALEAGDLAAARELAARGRELEGGEAGELRHLAAFLDGLEGERRARYVAAAGEGMGRVRFTGRLEHEDLPPLLAAAEAQVVPSTFPEAFGMVSAEAAACGALPVCADHSGLAEVAAALAPALDPDLRDLLAFAVDDGGVEAIAARLVRWLSLEPGRRARARAALAAAARERYGWERVAEGVLAAAAGRLEELSEVEPASAASGGASG